MGSNPGRVTTYYPVRNETYFYHHFKEVVRERNRISIPKLGIFPRKERAGAEESLLYLLQKHALDSDIQILKAPHILLCVCAHARTHILKYVLLKKH